MTPEQRAEALRLADEFGRPFPEPGYSDLAAAAALLRELAGQHETLVGFDENGGEAYAALLALGWLGGSWDEGAINTLSLLRTVATDKALPNLERVASNILRRAKVQAMCEATAHTAR